MSLFEQWNELADMERTEEENNKFWNKYLEQETENYKYLLKHFEDEVVSGKLSELAEKFGMEKTIFIGFLDGINTSLKEELKLEELSEDSEIKLDIDFEKLYYNMLGAKAHWLYNLPEWDAIFSKEKREQIRKEYNRDHIAVSNKVGRNEACPCGSGKKYKKCCGKA